ncbi:fumarate hydratase subunit beta [Clostridium pascui]|nr:MULTISPECIES: Fe-S-containing hydro-lyase [Clostridium]KGK89322.1 fumarate hydratase [Clostridium sp. HMP27]MBM7869644.1 fumarate hydratase subunit beta [Clostridium pascui]
MDIRITTPLTAEKVKDLKAGDSVLLTGVIYTSRDAGHKRLVDLLDKGEELPVDLKDQIIYYVGPTPAKPGQPIGSAGPTTSYRMDPYAPRLLDVGLKGMIGKGLRSQEVVDAIKRNTGVYFAAIGGAAALMGKSVKKAEIVAYEDLGAEALRRLEVEDLPVVVVIDSEGNNLYEMGQQAYLNSLK